MNEQELRALVREAVERHLGGQSTNSFPPAVSSAGQGLTERRPSPSHTSHLLLRVTAGSGVDEGMCLIEPAVQCNHCGFCQSYGH